MKIKLVAFNLPLYYAWKKAFQNIFDIEVIDGDIFKEQGDALISPANSFGYMDGGLDLKISQHLGWEMEEKVRSKIIYEFNGELPVGQAIIIETNLSHLPYLISAPTMRVPMDISNTVNAYLAFKAILEVCQKHNAENSKKIQTILCPGLGTGEGRMPVEICARQMKAAYAVCIRGEKLLTGGLAGAVENHLYLLGKL